ncbi:hypothetical protein VKT23_007508 [Stygiomarasmius scandens]|uniref:Uncharacterized protein n=1 Tax=Marasmiellus scandens TaxID=2682957 RepID=A0ABR1JK34_9AGAR
MYQYYLDAEVCYAFLSDTRNDEDPRDVKSTFRSSRWFTRGWTLQELVAPLRVVFLDRDWSEIGTKWSLRDVLSAITSIPTQVLVDGRTEHISIACKMSWAAWRQTTRQEDKAYCLMGIFGVSMAPIYGEGLAKAFMRLQQEIIKYSDDRSIFAWIASPEDNELRGFFARSPFEFRASGNVISQSEDIGDKSSFSFANNGLHIHLPLRPDPHNLQSDPYNKNGLFLASLHCKTDKTGEQISVYLKKTRVGGQSLIRYRPADLLLSRSVPPKAMQEALVKETPMPAKSQKQSDSSRFELPVKLLLSARDSFSFIPPQTKPVVSTLLASTQGTSFDRDQDTEYITVYGDCMHELKYQDLHSGQRFTLFTGLKDGVLSSNLGVDDDANPTNGLVSHTSGRDRISVPLKRGGLVSLAIQATGTFSGKMLEIGFIPRGHYSSVMKELPPPDLGFTVQKGANVKQNVDVLRSLTLTLEETFPPDFYYRESGEQFFFSVNRDCSHRILLFKASHSSSSDLYQLAVVLGVRESAAWADILLVDAQTPETVEDIWISYFESGSRVQNKQQAHGSTSAALRFSAGQSTSIYDLTVIIAPRRTLQLGSHSARIQWVYRNTPG